jgi:hypothetical protein
MHVASVIPNQEVTLELIVLAGFLEGI